MAERLTGEECIMFRTPMFSALERTAHFEPRAAAQWFEFGLHKRRERDAEVLHGVPFFTVTHAGRPGSVVGILETF